MKRLIIMENKPQAVETPRIPKRRTIITMVAGKLHKQLSEHSLPLIQRYADECEADLHVLTESDVEGLPHPAHGKKRIQRWLLDRNRVCWIDIDILVKPETPDIFDEVRPGTLGIVDRGFCIEPHHIMHPTNLMPTYLQKLLSITEEEAKELLSGYNNKYYNTGVFVCDALSFPLKENEDIPVVNWMWEFFEQTYFNLRVFQKKIRVTELPWQYNAVDGFCPTIGNASYLLANSYMRHYTTSKQDLIKDAKRIQK